ncbi:MAG: hypothetical protein ACREE6_12695 [Limisphaerales bacterium]
MKTAIEWKYPVKLISLLAVFTTLSVTGEKGIVRRTVSYQKLRFTAVPRKSGKNNKPLSQHGESLTRFLKSATTFPKRLLSKIARLRKWLRLSVRITSHIAGSVLELVADCMGWAKHRRRKAATKLHLLLNQLKSHFPRGIEKTLEYQRRSPKIRRHGTAMHFFSSFAFGGTATILADDGGLTRMALRRTDHLSGDAGSHCRRPRIGPA